MTGQGGKATDNLATPATDLKAATPTPGRTVAPSGPAPESLAVRPGDGTRRELIALQQSAGNTAVQRLLCTHSPPDAGPENGRTVQRARPGMPGRLTDDINRVLDDTAGVARTDARMLAAIRRHIRDDPVNERVIARTDPRIVRRLPVDLTRASALVVLRDLGATLAQRIPTAVAAPAPTLAGILAEINAAPVAQRRAVLTEPALVAAINGAVSRPESLRALTALGAALREILNAGMRGAGAETAPMLRSAASAPTGQKAEVLGDGATRALLTGRLARADHLRILASLGAPPVDQLEATISATGLGAVDGAAAVRIATSASPAARDLVRADRALVGRLQTALAPAQMRDLLVALRASVADILSLVIGTPAGTEADLATVIGRADATQRRAALDDAALVGRIRGALPAESAWLIRQLLAFGSRAAIAATSPQIPALSNGAAYRVDAHLTAAEPGDGFTQALASLTARHRIDSGKFDSISFSAGVAADATLTFPGFAQDATTHRFAPTGKPKIVVGTAGVVNASVLVSALLREAARASRESRPATTDPSSAGAQASQAVQTLLFEIEHRADSGIGRYGGRMHELGTRLTTAFTALAPAAQRPFQARYRTALAAVAAVPAGATPAAAVSLTAAISTELARTPVGTAAIIAAVTAANDTARRPVAQNHALVDRVTTAMSRADALSTLTLLHAPLSQRLEYLLGANAPGAELVTAVTAATAADRLTVSRNRALLDRLVSTLGDAQVAPVMSALGGSLGDELDRALRSAAPAAGLATAIGAASASARQSAERNVALLERISASLGTFELWRVQLLLRFGTAAALPAAATRLLTSLAGGPAIAAVRLAMRALTDAELTAAKTLPGIRPMLMALLPTPADQVIALRMLDQGMLDEETGLGGPWSETLQVANAAGVNVPTVFPATSGYDLEYQRTGLICTVRINVTGAGAAVTANLPRSKQIWESNIERAWNRQYKLSNANHDIPLIFNVNFTSSSAHHNVAAHAGVPVWPGLNMLNWFVDDPATNAANREYVNNAAIHEFGHMIGNPDEYQLSQAHYTATVGTNPTTDPNATATPDSAGTNSFTNTNSVMGGQLPGTNLPGPVQMRHVAFMTTWLNAHRNATEPAFTLATA